MARAYHDAGMRAVIAPMMADRTFYRAIPGLLEAMPPDLRARAEAIRLQPYDASLATCRDLLASWPWQRDQLRPALAPTIPHHCTDEFLLACRDLAAEEGIGIQMHVAESKVQAVVGPKRYGTSLVGHLHELGLLSPTFTAAHAIWLDDDDIDRLAETGADGRAQSGQQSQARFRTRSHPTHARARGHVRHRHRRLPLIRQSECV